MNIINNINIKKISVINYRKKNAISNIEKKNKIKKNFTENTKRNIYNNQDHRITQIHETNKEIHVSNFSNNLSNMNNTIINNIKKTNHNQNFLDILTLIGHKVLIPGEKIIYTHNTNVTYGYFLPQDTKSTLIQIKDQNNQLIFSHLVGPQKSGNYIHCWNGEVDNVHILNTGVYKISIESENESGPLYVQPLVQGTIQSIDTMPNSNQYKINLGLMGTVDILDIKRIF